MTRPPAAGPAGRGTPRPARPGELADADRAGLVELAAAARRSHDWTGLADRLVRLRARGVPVAVLADAVGVGESRVRMVCRDHGPDPAVVGDPLAEQGWVDTGTAADLLGVGVTRLIAHAARADADGVAVMAGWTRLWHGPSLPAWCAGQGVGPGAAARAARQARADRVRALVVARHTVAAAAAVVGTTQWTAYRDLRAARADHRPDQG